MGGHRDNGTAAGGDFLPRRNFCRVEEEDMDKSVQRKSGTLSSSLANLCSKLETPNKARKYFPKHAKH